MSELDVAKIQRDFPLLEREVNGKRVTYLDSASSSASEIAWQASDSSVSGRPLPNAVWPMPTTAVRSWRGAFTNP